MTDVLPRLGPMDDNHHPRWVREKAVSQKGLKGSLVVVFEANGLGACFIDTDTRVKSHLTDTLTQQGCNIRDVNLTVG